ncbi:TetR/AcrR family transcriptional regulator [Paenibacillus protaetiae]|uniref:TetR family transcriptional regulator n=1 Tax=Paenibacillus protaetiae TaxID=2509456 RepID=A0A4P6EQW2_9BACL|nr:TetR-like C-terminal domain-containing protein [Paenibacillus protaetiae]QAY65244.1 TetR family transcriptional regulator [Paenibacillus protaetiae]
MSVQQSQVVTDRRIARTKQFISEAFVALLLKKDIEEIVIKDITETANVNRSTFYSYYRDKFDLLDHMVKDRLEQLNTLWDTERSQSAGYKPDFNTPDPFFVLLFSHMEENEIFYRVLLTKINPATAGADHASSLLGFIREAFYDRITALSMEQKQSVPLDLLLDYISFSTFHMARKWLEQRMIYSSRHMALQLTRLSILGAYDAMGVLQA